MQPSLNFFGLVKGLLYYYWFVVVVGLVVIHGATEIDCLGETCLKNNLTFTHTIFAHLP